MTCILFFCVICRGSFKIYIDCRFGEMIGVHAFPPSRVRRKVLEFSKLMPEVLQFELVARRDVWANLFQNYCLDRGDIGLYFFPISIERSVFRIREKLLPPFSCPPLSENCSTTNELTLM